MDADDTPLVLTRPDISDRARRGLRGFWGPLVFLVICVIVTADPPYDNSPPIRSDGVGYHAWTRAFVDRDLDFCAMGKDVTKVGAVPRDPDGELTCGNKYGMGLALLRLPVMAPFTAANHGQVRSGPEDAVNQWCSILAGLVAVTCMVAGARRLGVGRGLSNLVALLMAFGTGLFHYTTYDSSMTHVYLAALVAWLCYVGCRFVWGPIIEGNDPALPLSRGWASGTGVAAFFLVSIRVPSILLLTSLLALTAAVLGLRTAPQRARVWQLVRPATAGALLALSIQVAYNHYAYGIWTLFSYRGEEVSITALHQWEVMFSVRKGLYVWYPILCIALITTVLARRWMATAFTVAATAPLVLLYGSWSAWQLGGSFGHRGFVDVVPVCGVAFAYALSVLSRRQRLVVAGIAAAAAVLTIGWMAAYWRTDIPYDEATSQQLWRYGIGGDSAPMLLVRWLFGG